VFFIIRWACLSFDDCLIPGVLGKIAGIRKHLKKCSIPLQLIKARLVDLAHNSDLLASEFFDKDINMRRDDIPVSEQFGYLFRYLRNCETCNLHLPDKRKEDCPVTAYSRLH